jgi:ubiquinone/menaquinone biosynthesis C-methylase UbiE
MQEWNKKRKAMRHYDQLAQVYDTQYSEEQNAKIEAALNNTMRARALSQNEQVLDMGCGTGLLFLHVAKSAKIVVGIDVSSKILQKAQKRTEQLPNTAVIRADADYTPFQNQTFDQVFAITLLQNMPNPVETLREIKRVSKHQSTIVVTGLKKKFTQELFIRLLNKAGLEISTLKTNPQLKGYLSRCKN